MVRKPTREPTMSTENPLTTEIPAGFEPHFRKSPLTDPWEPLYSKRTERAVIIGLRLAKPHTNGRGLISWRTDRRPVRQRHGL
jgi:hypothetical protein